MFAVMIGLAHNGKIELATIYNPCTGELFFAKKGLTEAGCKVTNFKGEPWSLKDREILSANKYLHSKLLEIMNSK